ncbi:MAG: phytanoyl-CoA dioxygenase family protein [Fimbriimonadaceae bacterium]
MALAITTIQISDGERGAASLNDDARDRAVRTLRGDGVVVLAGAIPGDKIAILRERALADVEALAKREDAPFNWNRGNLQQDPPPFPPYLFREVLANEFAIQVTHRLLGDGMYNGFYSGNTAMPSEARQPVHADIGQLWPHQQHVHPPYGIIVNIPLVDVSARNGSTEIWPGTHNDPSVALQSGSIEATAEALARWRAIAPPVQPEMKAGSLMLRDVRLWHAGMPNRTTTPRPMIAMIHYVSWWPSDPFKLHASAEALLKHPLLRQNASYVADEIDHIASPHGHAYSDSTAS